MSSFFPDPGSMTSFNGLVGYANSITDGFVGIMILLSIGGASFFASKGAGFDRAFVYSSFLATICSIFLAYLGMVDSQIFYLCTALFTISVVILLFERSKSDN